MKKVNLYFPMIPDKWVIELRVFRVSLELFWGDRKPKPTWGGAG